MTDPTQLLNAIAQSLRITGAPAAVEPGVPLTIGLTPPIEPQAVTSLLQSPLSLDLTGGALAGGITGNLPVGLPSGTVDKALDLHLASSIVGKLTGKLPIPGLSLLNPQVDITWSVKDEHGHELVANRDFVAPDGLHALLLNLILIPTFTEAGMTAKPAVTRSISAEVTLRTGGIGPVIDGSAGNAPAIALARGVGGLGGIDEGVTVKVSVPPVRIQVPQIPLPRVLVLAKDLQFRGPVAVLLSNTTYVSSIPTILGLLKRVQSTLSLLTSVARLALMLAGIDALINMLEAPHIGVGLANRDNKINDLNDIDVDAGPWYSRWNDTEADNEMTSFVYVGPPRSSVSMFVPSYCLLETTVIVSTPRGGSLPPRHIKGAFRVTVGDALVALSRSLHGPMPELYPKAEDVGVLGARIDILKESGNFDDSLSSIQFD